ncbi:MAG: hypothetical protein JST82_09255 [Bacteroidetes bacterium]|nr:hypothetical protein [Bacteroidota bacterium]
MSNRIIAFFFLSLLFTQQSFAQPGNKTKKRKHTIYGSWGYNKEWYTRSTIHVSQPELNNHYSLRHVTASDRPGWNTTSIFKQNISIPQYNYRLGYMFNDDKGLGIEINFDHTKYIIDEGQVVNLDGTLNGQPTNMNITFNHANGFYYYLNNGANFLLFNFVKRWRVINDKKERIKIDAYGKIGLGPVIPHVENSFFYKDNEPHFQIGGWNAAVEGVVRATFFKYGYLEYCNKLDYARYSGLKIYKGKVHHNFGTYEMVLNIGVSVPL